MILLPDLCHFNQEVYTSGLAIFDSIILDIFSVVFPDQISRTIQGIFLIFSFIPAFPRNALQSSPPVSDRFPVRE